MFVGFLPFEVMSLRLVALGSIGFHTKVGSTIFALTMKTMSDWMGHPAAVGSIVVVVVTDLIKK